MSDTLLVERDGHVAILTLNRPEVLNALSAELRRALHTTIKEMDADGDIGAIVLTGADNRAFTAGFDLKEADSRGTRQDVVEENPAASKTATPSSASAPTPCSSPPQPRPRRKIAS